MTTILPSSGRAVDVSSYVASRNYVQDDVHTLAARFLLMTSTKSSVL